MNKAIIGLGSNIDPKENIKKAKEILAGELTILAESDFVQTKPIGYVKQSDFINGAVLIETKHSQEELERMLKNIESRLGRKKTDDVNGPRTIDLDVVIWNERIVDQDFYQREFLKKSVMELLPELQY